MNVHDRAVGRKANQREFRMWQQAFRDQIKASDLSSTYKVVLLDLADQLYSTTWTAQRGCGARSIGKRCGCSKDTASRALRAAITRGYLTKKKGEMGEPNIYTPVVRDTPLSQQDDTPRIIPSDTHSSVSSVSSEDMLAPLAVLKKEEGLPMEVVPGEKWSPSSRVPPETECGETRENVPRGLSAAVERLERAVKARRRA
jgi:hypothetical protein